MATKLRPYQSKAVADIRRALSRKRSVVLQMPTGAGKTRAATEIVSTVRGGVWFVCHRQEIIRQAGKAFAAAGIDFGVISPRNDFEPEKRIQIASVQTLKNRLRDLPEPKTVIWDECHHVAAKSWSKIREALPNARHVGLTATPERLDGKGLSEWFDTLICGPGVGDLIKQRYLSDFRYFAPSEPDLRKAKITAGDYNKSDIAKIMNTPVLIGDAVDEYLSKAKGKRALAFCSSVDASKSLVRRFKRKGIAAVHVDGTTPADERDQAVADLESGKIKVLSNVEVFTEGFDVPVIDAVILLRPTKSLMLFRQMVGRALRVASGKSKALILDHAGLWLDHGFPNDEIPWSLDGGARKARIASLRESGGGYLRRCPECKEVYRECVEVCDCGHVFEGGREIGKHDGRLYELRSAAPEGCVTRQEFSRLTGINRTTIDNWINHAGMPNQLGYPVLKDALGWVDGKGKRDELAKRHAPHGYIDAVSNAQFARETGISTNTILKLIVKGMPSAPNGWPLRSEALKWLAENHKSRIHRPFDVPDYENYVAPKVFEREHNLCVGMTYLLRQRGLPCASNGWVHSMLGKKWVEDNVATKAMERTETVKAFASRMNVDPMTIGAWKRKGLPYHKPSGKIYSERAEAWAREHKAKYITAVPKDDEYLTVGQFAAVIGVHPSVLKKGGRWNNLPRGPRSLVPKRRALEWVRNQRFATLHPMDVKNVTEYERRGTFSKRIGVTDGWPSAWAKRGLPCAPNGWVHIQRGLEWVRDNTNIKIPDSAWPKGARETLQAAE